MKKEVYDLNEKIKIYLRKDDVENVINPEDTKKSVNVPVNENNYSLNSETQKDIKDIQTLRQES